MDESLRAPTIVSFNGTGRKEKAVKTTSLHLQRLLSVLPTPTAYSSLDPHHFKALIMERVQPQCYLSN